MFKSIRYVLNENFSNLYRIFCIAKYELLADMRDSKFGIFWNFASPAIQVFTYWLIFGVAWNKKPIGDIEYLPWLVVGYAAWWFVQPCIQNGCSAVFFENECNYENEIPSQCSAGYHLCKGVFQPWLYASNSICNTGDSWFFSEYLLVWFALLCVMCICIC